MSIPSSKDTLYSNPVDTVSSFIFDHAVAQVFPDMLQRSIPGYQSMIFAIGLLAERYAQDKSICYDLGCSLGAVTFSMRHNIRAKQCKIVAVDQSDAMIERLQAHLDETNDNAIEVEALCADIRDINIEKASVVVLNFTLLFIPIEDRLALLDKIYQGLLPGGILILSEKLTFDDQRQRELHIDLHHTFKKSQGYSDLEVSQKRSALENVLLAETLTTHQQRLKQAGFSSAEVWFQYFNFASMIALK